MLGVLSGILSFVYSAIFDFVVFVLVDVVAKTPLREATCDAEKRTIWLYESIVLTTLSLLIYFFDHVPYILILLSAITVVYTQLYGRIDFFYWWNLVNTRWEEYKQHEESMDQMRLMSSRLQHSPVQTNAVMYPPYYLLQQQQQQQSVPMYGAGQEHITKQSAQKQPKDQQGWFSSNGQGWFGSKITKWFSKKDSVQSITSTPQVVNLPKESSQLPRHTMIPVPMKQLNDAVVPRTTGYSGNELRRRPLRGNVSTTPLRTMPPSPILRVPYPTGQHIPHSGSAASSVRTKFMSAFGLNSYSPKPPGLKNTGQNLCFMNCIVQSLARSPHLMSYLTVDVAKELECGVGESLLLTTFVEVLHQCGSPTNNISVLDPLTFRQAVSTLNSDLVAVLGQPQVQQDAAEFLMWVLEVVHNVLNKNRKALQYVNNGSRRLERYSSPTLAMLKFIYGDLNNRTIQDLKTACRREIELANGLENDSYAEPIQRLSDLEWLQHKQDNESIVDDLFTGQLVEAYHCLTDNHISVNLQAFNVLPVPIAAPRQVSGVVNLEDCFTTFCHIEHLMGSEELNCSHCRVKPTKGGKKGVRYKNDVGTSTTPQTRSATRLLSADSAIGSPTGPPADLMSPIAGQRDMINDSGYHDNIFRTSTPIIESCKGVGNQSQHVRDVQRRCLLRQLPECLAIQLMRFTFNQRTGRSVKIKAPVHVRIKDLNLTNIIYDSVTRREDLTAVNSSHTYDLYSVCVHLGAESTNHGHYVCYTLVADNKWYRFDDENVTQVNMEYELTTKELRENAYLLFYKRVTVS